MRKSALAPPFLEKALLRKEFFVAARGIGHSFDISPYPFFLFPAQFVVHESLYVEIRDCVLRHCHYKKLK